MKAMGDETTMPIDTVDGESELHSRSQQLEVQKQHGRLDQSLSYHPGTAVLPRIIVNSILIDDTLG